MIDYQLIKSFMLKIFSLEEYIYQFFVL